MRVLLKQFYGLTIALDEVWINHCILFSTALPSSHSLRGYVATRLRGHADIRLSGSVSASLFFDALRIAVYHEVYYFFIFVPF